MKPGKTVSPAWRPSESALETLVSFDHIEMRRGGREEVLDEVSEDYPYLPVLSQHDRYHNRTGRLRYPSCARDAARGL